MSKRIFVGNLSWKASEDQLKALFEVYGAVTSVRIITDQFTGKSKGFGFVEMEDAGAVQKAVDELNDKPFLERNLRVSLAHERQERRPNESRGGGGGAGGQGFGGNRRSQGFNPRFERNYSG